MLSVTSREALLSLARERIRSSISGDDPSYPPRTHDLEAKAGAFVTLTNPHRYPNLRGCIGRVEAREPIYDTVHYAAYQSAFCDPRFDPIQPDELPSVLIEISLLLPPRAIEGAEQIEVGTHGIIVRSETHRGILLPQVATERNWSRDEFLAAACKKAGLHPDAWASESVRLFVFEAEVFDESGERI